MEWAEYLCNENYKEITYIPPSVHRQQSLRNIALYMHLVDSLLVWKDFIIEQRPEIMGMEPYLSLRALPDLLTKGLGSITLRHFLQLDCEVTLKEELEEMETDLVPVADFFHNEQLIEAHERLRELYDLIEGLEEEEVG